MKILFVATGKTYFYEAVFSAQRVKEVMPQAEVALVTNEDFLPQAKQLTLFDKRIILPDCSFNFFDKVRGILLSPWRQFVYLDSDTYLARPLDELSSVLARAPFSACIAEIRETPKKYSRGLSLDQSLALPEYNTGVLGVGLGGYELLQSWHDQHVRLSSLAGGDIPDQISFRAMLLDLKIPMHALPAEFNFHTPFPCYLDTHVWVVHGRLGQLDHKKYAKFASRVNRRSGPRIYIPGLGVFGGYGTRMWDWVRVVERARRLKR